MGQSQSRLKKQAADWKQDILDQIEYDQIQIPQQKNDKWFRGVAHRNIPELLKVWAEFDRGETLKIVCIDRFWVELIWRTPKGSEKIVNEFQILVDLSRAARDNAIRKNAADKKEGWKYQEQLYKEGNWGTAYWVYLCRYLYCLPINPKRPHNMAKIYPLVEAYQCGDRLPDEMTSFTFYDLNDTLIIKREDDYQPPCPEEEAMFRECLRVL